jgi:hypothetical protein
VKVIAKEMGIDLLEWGEGADESTIGSGTGWSHEQSANIQKKLTCRARIVNFEIDLIPLSTLVLSS